MSTADGLLEELSVNVDGEVETQDTGGLILDAVERFPPSLFLREHVFVPGRFG